MELKKKGKEKGKKKEKKVSIKPKTWNIEDSTYHSCPYANVTVFVPAERYDEIMKVYLYGLANGIEISIYAKIVDNVITEIYVPDQENNEIGVGLQETVPLTWNCIIHSHPSEIKSFSQQDWLTLLVNRDCCLLINQGKFTDGKYRVNMPCGSVLYSDVRVKIEENSVLIQKIKKAKMIKPVQIFDGFEDKEWYKEMYGL